MEKSQEAKLLKVKIDGKDVKLELKSNINTEQALRLIEYKYLFPERGIKHVERNGKTVLPYEIQEINDIKTINIITENMVDMILKQVKTIASAFSNFPGIIDDIARNYVPDVTKFRMDNLLSSIEWSLKFVEENSRYLPIMEGLDESILSLESTIMKLDELMNGNEEEAVEFFRSNFKLEVIKWGEFLRNYVVLIERSSKEIH